MPPDNQLELRLFVGTTVAVRRLASNVEAPRLFRLDGVARLAIWPIDDDLHDALHRTYGTGDWLKNAVRLSTRDLEFGAKYSLGEKLAYLEAVATPETFHQAAAAWRNGVMCVQPTALNLKEDALQSQRPRKLWPLNVALTALGVSPVGRDDAIAASGLAHFASNAEILANAQQLSG